MSGSTITRRVTSRVRPGDEASAERSGAVQTWTRRRLLKVTALCWAVTFAFGAVWSLSTPFWTTPDAPAHELMAYNAVRDLHVHGTNVYANGGTSNAITRAPTGLVGSAATAGCYAFKTTSAACLKYPTNDPAIVDFINPAGRYLPTYYLATGWPSLLTQVKYVIWGDRAAATAIASFFLAWAASAALTRRRRSVALTGVVLSATPMVLYFSGAVNPNSLEITAGMALAACSIAFLQEQDPWLRQVMFRRTMIAATVMVTIRMLAPVWVLAWLLAFVLVMTRDHWRHALSRHGIPWVALPILGTMFNAAYTFTSGVTHFQPHPRFHHSLWQNLTLSKSVIDGTQLQQQLGIFGWLDTPLYPGLFTIYEFAALFVIVVACTRLTNRELAAVVVLLAAQYLLPILMQALQYNTNGPVWQGRYTLPLTTAVPIFALMLAAPRFDGSRTLPRVTWAFPVALGLLGWVQFRALTIEMRRNVNGYNGPSYIHGAWQPPFGALTLLVVQALLVVLTLALLVRLYRQDRHLETGPELADQTHGRHRDPVPAGARP